MNFRILGPLEVFSEDGPLAIGGSKQRALLAVLLLHANETLTTDRLIDELWGEHPPSAAAKTVQVHVSRLRKALAAEAGDETAGVLVTREHGYELTIDPELIDAYRFERAVESARDDLGAARPQRALASLERALSMWRGEPLADLAYEPFVHHEALRLDELRLVAVEQLIEAKLALGRHTEVVGRLESLIAEHPYREGLQAQLMLALYRSDRQADALQAYQDARRKLVGELGIEPGARLRELERAILAHDPALTLVTRDEPRVDGVQSVFVGRGRELDELVAALGDAIDGRGRLCLVTGEPGIGKSRLGEELIASARSRGALVLVGRCWEAGGAPAYWPWVQSLRSYVRDADPAILADEVGAGGGHLAQILPELRDRLPDLPTPQGLEPESARFKLFDATATFLMNASARRPIVLALDDLHAADVPSLLLLRFVARDIGAMRLLVLGAYRNVDPVPGDPLTEMLGEVAREPVTRRLVLGGLSEDAVAEYVSLTAGDAAPTELAARLHAQTEGNPLFVGELVRLLTVEGFEAGPGGDPALSVPPGVRDVIARRLTHVSEQCNRVLVFASILGREFGIEALARLGSIPESELFDPLDEAAAVGVVADVPGAPGRLRFAHVLMRDMLYDGLTSARRLQLHRAATNALAELYGDEAGPHLAELAHHATAARDFEQAKRYAWRAGDRALTLLAYEESARLYAAALEAQDGFEASDEADRCELLLALGDAQARAGDAPAAKETFLRAAEIARRLGMPRALARAAVGYGGRIVFARAGDDCLLVPLLEEGLAALGGEEVELRTRLLARLAGALRDEPSRARRAELSAEAVRLARRIDDPLTLAYALDGRAAAIIAPDVTSECHALATELLELARRCGNPELVIAGHSNRTLVELMTGDLGAAEADGAAAARIAEDLRQPSHLWRTTGERALMALSVGRLDEAEHLIAYGLELGERAQREEAIPVHRMQRYALNEFRGELEAVLDEIREVAEGYPARPVFRCALVHLYASLGRSQDAARDFEALTAADCAALPFDQEWLYAMSLLAETSALVDDRESAAVLYRLLAPWSTFVAADLTEGFRGSVLRQLGLLAATTEHWDDAERHFEEALSANARMNARPWVGRTAHEYAEMLLTRRAEGDAARAGDLLARALDIYREIGLDRWAAQAAASARRAK